MAIPKSQPMRFTPRGLTDAFDATDRFPGACQALQNLIFDEANPELVLSRPGITEFANFTGINGPLWGDGSLWAGGQLWNGGNNSPVVFTDPGFISIQKTVGSRVYGMIATNRYPGHDEPFCFDKSTGNFIAIAGILAANTPVSPPTIGDWVPPTLTVVGTMVVITHPGFDGSASLLWGGGALWGDPGQYWGTGLGYYGIIDLTNPNAPTWRSENTATNGLTAVPQAVANLNNRAYFAVGNKLQYTDVLTNPLTRTNATQSLTLGDMANINALDGLPIQTTSSGVLAVLTAFKETQCWQISGDTTTNNLSENYISLTVGTNAPRTVVQSPLGLYFVSTGGPYIIDPLGTLRPLTHNLNILDPDLLTPFENAQTPTRWAAAYNSSIYRVCGPTILRGVQQTNDYWFHEKRRRWTGPHSFAYDCASAFGGLFVLSSYISPGRLFQSPTQQNLSFTNADLGTVLQCKLLSSTFPKVGDMAMKQVAESQIELAASGGDVSYLLIAQDDQGREIGRATIGVVAPIPRWDTNVYWDDGVTVWYISNLWGGGGLWGAKASLWGAGPNWGDPQTYWVGTPGSGLLWGAGMQAIPHTYPVPWPAPLVFEKMQLQITAPASAAVAIGTFYARYQRTGWMTLGPPIS